MDQCCTHIKNPPIEKYEKQTARGYLIKCSDGEFFVEEDCFKFSDFLYEQIQGKSLNESKSLVNMALLPLANLFDPCRNN